MIWTKTMTQEGLFATLQVTEKHDRLLIRLSLRNVSDRKIAIPTTSFGAFPLSVKTCTDFFQAYIKWKRNPRNPLTRWMRAWWSRQKQRRWKKSRGFLQLAPKKEWKKTYTFRRTEYRERDFLVVATGKILHRRFHLPLYIEKMEPLVERYHAERKSGSLWWNISMEERTHSLDAVVTLTNNGERPQSFVSHHLYDNGLFMKGEGTEELFSKRTFLNESGMTSSSLRHPFEKTTVIQPNEQVTTHFHFERNRFSTIDRTLPVHIGYRTVSPLGDKCQYHVVFSHELSHMTGTVVSPDWQNKR